jgi:hypothetical protein
MKFGLQRAHQGRTRFRFQSACRRANQARQAEWLLLALLCQDCSMLARISKQARYTSKLSLCTASDCRETSWQSQLPWEIRSRVTQGTQSTQSTQREGSLPYCSLCRGSPLWTLRKVVPCVLQHNASTSISGTSDAARARAGDGEQAHCLSQRARGSTCDKARTTSQAPHPHRLGGRSSPCPSGVGVRRHSSSSGSRSARDRWPPSSPKLRNRDNGSDLEDRVCMRR